MIFFLKMMSKQKAGPTVYFSTVWSPAELLLNFPESTSVMSYFLSVSLCCSCLHVPSEHFLCCTAMINQLTYHKVYLQLFWNASDHLEEQFVRQGQNVKISTAESVWGYSAPCSLNSRHLHSEWRKLKTLSLRHFVTSPQALGDFCSCSLKKFSQYLTVEDWNHDWYYCWSYLISPAADWISFSFWTAVCVQTIFNISEVM